MQRLADFETKDRGISDFPVALYEVDERHPEFNMRFHWHPEVEIIYVEKGRFPLMINESVQILQEGDIAYLPAMTLHGGNPDSGCIYTCIVFLPEHLTHGFHYRDLSPLLCSQIEVCSFYPKRQDPNLSKIVCRMRELLRQPELISNRVEIFGLLLQFYAVLSRRIGTPKEKSASPVSTMHRVSLSLHYMENHYAEKITLADLAAAAEVTPKYLCRIFTMMTGKTPIIFLNEYRIDCACRLLRESDTPLLDVALQSGFDDQSYFTKLFRRQTGTTPRAYRLQFRG